MKQKIDIEYPIDSDRYQLEKDLLLKSLNERFPNYANIYGTKFNPYPVKVDDHILNKISIIHQTIILAVEKIVENYFDDLDIQLKLPLCDRSKTILKLARNVPYSVGSLRPDFLFDCNQTIKVCEINARFSTNGFIISDFLANYFSQKSSQFDGKLIEGIIANFDTKNPIRIIKGVEMGYDINLIIEEFHKNHSAIDIDFVKPNELSLKENKLYAKNIACNQFLLELQQHEILSLPLPILINLVRESKCFNDIRTILIAHDKRLLSILGDRNIMARYIDREQVDLLSKHIIYTSNIDKKTKNDILHYPDKWVLKKYLLGKAEGMYLVKELTRKELKLILKKDSDLYVAQHYVEQKLFPILSIKDNDLLMTNKHLVGLSMSFNHQFIGMGVFRAGTRDIINLSTEDGEIIPAF